MIDYTLKFVGILTVAAFAWKLLWPILKSAMQTTSVVALMLVASYKHGNFKAIKWMRLPTVWWKYYIRFLFSWGEITRMSNKNWSWSGIFRWHIFPANQQPTTDKEVK
jgi:carbon starvation protein CstA